MSPPSPTPTTPSQPLPRPLLPHAQALTTFQQSCQNLCLTLLTHLSTALATPPDWFTTRHDLRAGPSGTVFRMLYYPAVEPTGEDEADGGDGGDLRAGAHSDFGSLTLLFQLPGQPGLEILTPGGEWAGVPVDPRGGGDEGEEGQGRGQRALPILVNVGDLLEDVRSPLFFSLFLLPVRKAHMGN